MTLMARGKSGRIVIEVDPDLKNALYVELARLGMTLKDWFIGEAERLVAAGRQPSLFDSNDIDRTGGPSQHPRPPGHADGE